MRQLDFFASLFEPEIAEEPAKKSPARKTEAQEFISQRNLVSPAKEETKKEAVIFTLFDAAAIQDETQNNLQGEIPANLVEEESVEALNQQAVKESISYSLFDIPVEEAPQQVAEVEEAYPLEGISSTESEVVAIPESREYIAAEVNKVIAQELSEPDEVKAGLPEVDLLISEPTVKSNAEIFNDGKISVRIKVKAPPVEAKKPIAEELRVITEEAETPLEPVVELAEKVEILEHVDIIEQLTEVTEPREKATKVKKATPKETTQTVAKKAITDGAEPIRKRAASVQLETSGMPVSREKTNKLPQKRGRKSFKEIDAEVDLIEVPDDEALFQKQYYTISVVAKWFRVNTSLLRFWENEFDVLKPRKNRKGDRLFRPEDVKNLQLIYHLLRQRKYTIEGAKEYLKTHKKKADLQMQLTNTLQKFKGFLLELRANLQQ